MGGAQAAPFGDTIEMVARLAEPAAMIGWARIVGETDSLLHVERGSRLVGAWFKGRSAAHARADSAEHLMARLIGAMFPWADGMIVEDVHVEDWGSDPYSLGGYSYPAVGRLDEPAIWAAPL